MFGRVLLRVLKGRFLFNSTHNYYYCMEAKELRIVDYKTEQYGDYPFIQSTFQSGRKWTPIAEVDQKL